MVKELAPDVKALAKNIGEDIKSSGYNADALLNPEGLRDKKIEAALGPTDGQQTAANDKREEKTPTISGGKNVEFVTQPTPESIAKKKAGPPLDKDGNLIPQKGRHI